MYDFLKYKNDHDKICNSYFCLLLYVVPPWVNQSSVSLQAFSLLFQGFTWSYAFLQNPLALPPTFLQNLQPPRPLSSTTFQCSHTLPLSSTTLPISPQPSTPASLFSFSPSCPPSCFCIEPSSPPTHFSLDPSSPHTHFSLEFSTLHPTFHNLLIRPCNTDVKLSNVYPKKQFDSYKLADINVSLN